MKLVKEGEWMVLSNAASSSSLTVRVRMVISCLFAANKASTTSLPSSVARLSVDRYFHPCLPMLDRKNLTSRTTCNSNLDHCGWCCDECSSGYVCEIRRKN